MELAGKTVAISGIGGFIGGRMAERAREQGMQVRGLEVSAEAARRAEAAGATVVVGDVADPAAARALCQGADVVFHAAAVVQESGPWELFRRVNVEGTRNVAEAARDAGVSRLVHLSSVMVYGFRYPANVAEDGPLRGEGNPYCQTKIESEQAAMACHAEGGMGVVVIRPGDVYGPGSGPWVVRPLQLMSRGVFVLIDMGLGKLNPVYIDDLIDAVFLALEQDAAGEAFNVTGGEAVTCAEYFGRLAKAAGKGHLFTAPSYLMYVLALSLELGAKAMGKQSPFTRASLRFVLRPHAYSIEKARRVLGYAPKVSLIQGMAAVEAWLAGGKATPSPT